MHFINFFFIFLLKLTKARKLFFGKVKRNKLSTLIINHNINLNKDAKVTLEPTRPSKKGQNLKNRTENHDTNI